MLLVLQEHVGRDVANQRAAVITGVGGGGLLTISGVGIEDVDS